MTIYLCGHCNEKFNTIPNFKIHTRTKHHYIFCYICDMFLHVSKLTKHIKKNHPRQYADLGWKCKFCGELLSQDRYKKGKIIESKKHKCSVSDYFKLMQPLKIDTLRNARDKKTKSSIENTMSVDTHNILTRKYMKIQDGKKFTFATKINSSNLNDTNLLVEKVANYYS